MEVVTIEKKTYEAMMERFRILTAKVDALCRECDEKRMGRWLDNQDVCQILNISLRTLQRYRASGTLPFHIVYHKTWYLESEILAFMKAHFTENLKRKRERPPKDT